jgi:hypothetical protein
MENQEQGTAVQDQTEAPVKNKKRMVKPQAGKVLIKTNYPCLIGGKVVKPGHEVEATEAEAREFCDRPMQGPFAFSGERPEAESIRHRFFRAERVNKD